MASVQQVANKFLEFAKDENRSLTNMQLQKLVFLAQGYSLALLGRAVYQQDTHAWQWGPVVPKLYKALQRYGSGSVDKPVTLASDNESALTEDETTVLRGVWNGYKRYSGAQLSELTHRPGTPWSKTWESHKFGVIPIQDIQSYYTRLIADIGSESVA